MDEPIRLRVRCSNCERTWISRFIRGGRNLLIEGNFERVIKGGGSHCSSKGSSLIADPSRGLIRSILLLGLEQFDGVA